MRTSGRVCPRTKSIDGQDAPGLERAGKVLDSLLGTLRGALSAAPAVGDYKVLYYLAPRGTSSVAVGTGDGDRARYRPATTPGPTTPNQEHLGSLRILVRRRSWLTRIDSRSSSNCL